MANVELGKFCELEEYKYGRKSRLVDPAQLSVNGAYTIMMRLRSSNVIYQAARKAIMLIGREYSDDDSINLQLTFLDDDCQKEAISEAHFSSGGYISDFPDVVIFDRDDPSQRFPIDQAYLQPYPDYLIGFDNELGQSMPIPIAVPEFGELLPAASRFILK